MPPVPSQGLPQAEIVARLQEQLGSRALKVTTCAGQSAVTIRPADLREALIFLRDDSALQFSWLMDVGGVDWMGYGSDEEQDAQEWRFEVAYQLYSLEKNHRIRLKVAVGVDGAGNAESVPSVWDLWGVANWMEREVWDLFGIAFDGHPNLRRIMCHDEFVGHALRKDYPINRRQKLSRPSEMVLCGRHEWA
jgi:NADH/F420H2 dehydrogenase subunit C